MAAFVKMIKVVKGVRHVKVVKDVEHVLIRNAAQCRLCHKVVESTSPHHCVECGCTNGTMVDGGLERPRMGARNFKYVKTLYDWDPPLPFNLDTHQTVLDDSKQSQA